MKKIKKNKEWTIKTTLAVLGLSILSTIFIVIMSNIFNWNGY